MPVRRFRSVEEMEAPEWRKPGDPTLFRTIAALWDFGARTAPRTYPRGIHKHRSVEEMNHLEALWAEANVRALRARRRGQAPRPTPEA